MSNKLKEIDIKICACYFFDDMINIRNLYPNKIEVDEKSYKNILIYHIGYVKMKDLTYAKLNNINSLYLIIDKINGYIEESNGNKYLTLVHTVESKDMLKKCEEPWKDY